MVNDVCMVFHLIEKDGFSQRIEIVKRNVVTKISIKQ